MQAVAEKPSKYRLNRLLLAFWLGYALLAAQPASGTDVAEQGWPAGLRVEQNEAVADFPAKITFRFRAAPDPAAPAIRWIELAYRVEGEAATTVRRQSPGSSGSLEAQFVVDTRLDYIPPGARVLYYWLLGDFNGEVHASARQELLFSDTRYNFKELKAGVITLRWYQGDLNFGRTALAKAQAAVERLSRQYKVQPDRPINVTIYPDANHLFGALPPNSQTWIGGQAIPELGTIVLAVPPGDRREMDRSIPHEISHHVIYQATRNPYNVPPKWLDEGLAVNNQEQADPFLQEAFEQARANRTLYGLRVLNGVFPADTQKTYLAYGQSLQVVRYIIKQYGQAAIERMLAALKEGVSYDEMTRAGVGLTVEQLDREWKQSIGYPVAAAGLDSAGPGSSRFKVTGSRL